MAWKDRLQPASFRGIAFDGRVTSTSFDRNIVSHSYLLTNDVSGDDIGRKPDSFQIEAVIIGDDYMDRRDALIAACRDKAGAGILIHPYLGRKNVFVRGLRISETFENGRMATISIDFQESGTKKFPDISEDSSGQLTKTADTLISDAKDRFAKTAQLNLVSDYVRQGVTAPANTVLSNMQGQIDGGVLSNAVNATTLLTDDYINNFANLSFNFNSLIAAAPSLISSAIGYSDLVATTFNIVNLIGQDGKSARKVLAAARDISVTLDSEITNDRKIRNINQKAVQRLFRVVGIAEEVKSIENTTFESRDEALLIRNDLIAEIDDLMISSSDDIEYDNLRKVKTDVVKLVPPPELNLPRVKNLVLPETLPSLVLSYKLYGSAESSDDIVQRNKIDHPGFVVAGENLEVLLNE